MVAGRTSTARRKNTFLGTLANVKRELVAAAHRLGIKIISDGSWANQHGALPSVGGRRSPDTAMVTTARRISSSGRRITFQTWGASRSDPVSRQMKAGKNGSKGGFINIVRN